MKNKIFQFVWHCVVKWFIPVGAVGLSPIKLARYHRRNKIQIKLARLFGKIDLVLFGDSNMAVADSRRKMSLFKDITINFAIGGTTADDYNEYFSTWYGAELLLLIKGIQTAWSIGGNHVLKRAMATAGPGLKAIRNRFPKSWVLNIPPIQSWMIAGVDGRTARDFETDVSIINNYLHELWGNQCVDIHSILTDPQTAKGYPGALKDPVHFGSFITTIIIKFLRRV